MRAGRAFSLLTGVALLGAIAAFNEMTPDAQASLVGAAVGTARSAAQSLVSNAVAAYNGMIGRTDAAAQPQPARGAAPRAEGAAGDAPPPRRLAARPPDGEESSPGNPLWALPLKQLSMTRDRPIFSPSRRPPPPPPPAFVAPVAVRQQPAKPAEPERPTVSLLGTILGSNADDQIGVFLDTATQTVVRLRVGEDHQGWVLRTVKAREVALAKGSDPAVVIAMPAPGESPPGLGNPMLGMPAGIMPPPGNLPPAYQSAIANGLPGQSPAAVAAQQRQQRQQRRQR